MTPATDPPPDGRRRHYGLFYGVDPLPPGPLLLVHGNCQAESLRILLSGVPELGVTAVRMPPVFELTQEDLTHLDTLLARTTMLISQPIHDGYRDMPLGTAEVAARLPPGATVLRWPVIRHNGFHPFQVIVRDPRDPSRDPPVVPYHDLRTLASARHGQDLFDRSWPDDGIAAVVAADRAELHRREARDCDVAVSDLFDDPQPADMTTVNHPGNRILLALAGRIAGALGVDGNPVDPGRVLLGSVLTPVHPQAPDLRGRDPGGVDWILGGQPVSARAVHEAQLQWYLDSPWVIDSGWERHAQALTSLGLQ